MTDGYSNDEPESDPPPWADRVTVRPGADGFAHVPGEVITADVEPTRRRLAELFPGAELTEEPLNLQDGRFTRLRGALDVPRAVRYLRSFGILAQPNHVFFAHCAERCCPPHPAFRGGPGAPPTYVGATPVYGSSVAASSLHGAPVYGSPVYGSPVYGSPVYGSPVYGSPVYGSPVYGSPVYGSPVYGSPVYGSPVYGSDYATTGRRRSSARPVEAGGTAAILRQLETIAATSAVTSAEALPDVVVLDTGLATGGRHGTGLLTALSDNNLVRSGDGIVDVPDQDADDLLDPAAGHGTFIALLVERVAPGARVQVWQVLHPQGDGAEGAIADAIWALPDRTGDGDPGAVLNLSFGGYVMEEGFVLEAAIAAAQSRGYVVVASAGNDGVCRPTFPAAFPDVVSVGAVGPSGPAPFTNYGPWVRACAPGVDLVSTFFAFDGAEREVDGHDPDRFDGWARWSGTSFAAPIVAGALAHRMLAHGTSARAAVEQVIDAPTLLRLADLGTVVNLA